MAELLTDDSRVKRQAWIRAQCDTVPPGSNLRRDALLQALLPLFRKHVSARAKRVPRWFLAAFLVAENYTQIAVCDLVPARAIAVRQLAVLEAKPNLSGKMLICAQAFVQCC